MNTTMCLEHSRHCNLFCVDCLIYICAKCNKTHHSKHHTVKSSSLTSKPACVTEAYTKCAEHADIYQRSLSKELQSLDDALVKAMADVDDSFEPILHRMNEKKRDAILKVKALISSQRRILTERKEANERVIEGYRSHLDADSWSAEATFDVMKKRRSQSLLSVPSASLAVSLQTNDLIIPEAQVELKRVTFCVPVDQSQPNTRKLTVTKISEIGEKGSQELQFKLPGGVCLDKDNNVYVADEGNNRIQKINKDGRCIGTFTWGKTDCFITDVKYDPSTSRLIVPRAHSEYGLLKCSTFSYVTLDGCEVGRFVVPGMQGGLFVNCNKEGNILITDVVKKSIFLIKDGHAHLEIHNLDHLKQPAQCTFGRDDEILAVDSARRVVAVFDHDGLYIRDIGSPGDGAGELKKPSGISIDLSCGIVAVTDWCGDKVVLYSYEGEVLASVPGFKCPHSITISEHHRLAVTDSWNSQLKVYSYSHSE